MTKQQGDTKENTAYLRALLPAGPCAHLEWKLLQWAWDAHTAAIEAAKR